ncbi:hypothetical protein E2C01_010241 [Portunus trituberculatus]|uniref:Uncharacterized protein n=1 Tax=Portunus trituberculatus TaxID=210409 RepID=A0A5B7D7V7_PORTR|nr:hypothetical protein [Portunus trituberculatus]
MVEGFPYWSCQLTQMAILCNEMQSETVKKRIRNKKSSVQNLTVMRVPTKSTYYTYKLTLPVIVAAGPGAATTRATNKRVLGHMSLCSGALR